MLLHHVLFLLVRLVLLQLPRCLSPSPLHFLRVLLALGLLLDSGLRQHLGGQVRAILGIVDIQLVLPCRLVVLGLVLLVRGHVRVNFAGRGSHWVDGRNVVKVGLRQGGHHVLLDAQVNDLAEQGRLLETKTRAFLLRALVGLEGHLALQLRSLVDRGV